MTYLNSSPRFLLYFPSEQLIVGVIIIVYQFKTEKGTFPPFSKFVKFLSREADIACNPVISSHSMKEDDNKKPTDGMTGIASISLDIKERHLVQASSQTRKQIC